MEFIPVLERSENPEENMWYSLSPRGNPPDVSVGHTCMYIPSRDEGMGSVLIIGGADPSGSFTESYILNLDNLKWEALEWKGLEARYEHCSFIPQSCPWSVWVFGGAQQIGNHNSIQKLELKDREPSWKDIEARGNPPTPRTYHTNTACIKDMLYVFSGGEVGAVPVSDNKLHIFDTVSFTWSQPKTTGPQPPARHGHIIVAVGSKLYIHGGMAGPKFHNDMYMFDSINMTWEKIEVEGDVPPGVAAHSAAVLDSNIYIFGGLTEDGATNTMYKFFTDKNEWVLMEFEGDVPPNRLDHSMCVVPWWPKGTKNKAEEESNNLASKQMFLAFVFGGMDTHGVIYNDCVVTIVK